MSLVPVLFGLISSVTKRIPLVLIPGLISGLAYVIPLSVIKGQETKATTAVSVFSLFPLLVCLLIIGLKRFRKKAGFIRRRHQSVDGRRT
jgi:hypothetical protein